MKNFHPLSKDDSSVQHLFDVAYAFQKSMVFLTACELEIFTVLGNKTKSSKEIAYETGTDERATERLLNALCALSLLIKREGKFANTKTTLQYLVKDQPEFLGSMVHLNHYWERWTTLTESIKLGTAAKYKDISEKSDEWLSSFIASLHWESKLQAPEVITAIGPGKFKKILDLGGGSGAFSMEFARSKPDAEIFLFDLPRIIKFARHYLSEAQFADRIKTIEGDYLTDSIGKGYDLVFMSAILPLHTIWENISLAQKVYDSLNPGGYIVIHNQLISDNRTQPLESTLTSLNLLVNTKAGDVYTETEIWIILKEAWFNDIFRRNTGFGTSLMIGNK